MSEAAVISNNARLTEVTILAAALSDRILNAQIAGRQILPECPSSDDLGHSAVFRSGGSGPSG
ncbi:hypothetical protein ACFQ12_27750, partial [Methylobacterium trifolii]